MRCRIAHFTTVHSRSDIRILIKECLTLSQAGYEVHLIVGDGMGDEVFENVMIHDIGVKPNSRIKRMWFQPKKAQKKIMELNPSVLHFHDPELLPLGIKLAKKNTHIIYDAHEDTPRAKLVAHYIPKIIRPLVAKLFEFYENHAVKELAGVVAATPHIASRFLKQGIKTINVNNYSDVGELAALTEKKSRKKQVCYIGGISRLRGLRQVIQALPLVPGVRLILCGEFNEGNFEKELRSKLGWAQVDYRGQVDRFAAKRIMKESCVGLATFLPAPNHINAQPNKIFEYMSANLPVIGSNFPLWREIIEETGCGICVDPESPQAIAHAINSLLAAPEKIEQMGCAGHRAVLDKYNWLSESRKLIDFYQHLLQDKRSSA